MGEFLIGGASSEYKRKLRFSSKKDASEPVMVGPRFLSIVVCVGASLVFLGYLSVSHVFEIRDYEMESRRMQALTEKVRMAAIEAEAEVSSLQGAGPLRERARDEFGMAAPTVVEQLVVPGAVQNRWDKASEEVAVYQSKGGSI